MPTTTAYVAAPTLRPHTHSLPVLPITSPYPYLPPPFPLPLPHLAAGDLLERPQLLRVVVESRGVVQHAVGGVVLAVGPTADDDKGQVLAVGASNGVQRGEAWEWCGVGGRRSGAVGGTDAPGGKDAGRRCAVRGVEG